MNLSLNTPAAPPAARTEALPWATRFAALLQREWYQHRIGWMVITAVPLLVALLVLVIGEIQLDVDDAEVVIKLGQVAPLVLAVVTILSTGILAFVLAWMSTLFMAPGLARRDLQDRSAEFWLSLPIGPSTTLAAPLLAHLLLFPLAALGIGMVAGHLLSLVVVARFAGVGEWFALPWGQVLLVTLATTLRTALGLLLATVWLLPLVLLVMVASAWLKRWGIPALVAAIVVSGKLMQNLFGSAVVWDLIQALLLRAGRSLVYGHDGDGGGLRLRAGDDPGPALQAFPGWAAADAWQSVKLLADPLLLLALAASAGLFALLVLRRRRGG